MSLMLRLIDKDGKPTKHASTSSKELVAIAQSIWGHDAPVNTAEDDEKPNGWRLEADAFTAS